MKQELIDNIMAALSSKLDADQLMLVKNTLLIYLNDYDIISNKYEITTEVKSDDDILKMYLVSKKIDGLSDRTLRGYEKELNRLLHMYIKKSCLEYTGEDLKFHFARRMIDNPNLSKVTLNNERRYFSAFFQWLNDNDYIVKNPMKAIKMMKEDKTIKKAFTEEEVERMREKLIEREKQSFSKKDKEINTRNIAIFEFLLSTGCRVSELTNAKMKNLDLVNKEVIVFGKGAKERTCYLNTKSVMALQKYLDIRHIDSDYIFIPYETSFKYDHIEKSLVEVLVRELGRECGIEKSHPHKFRRTCATWALNKGMPIEEVQEMLGHEQMDTTLIYAKVNKKNVKASHEKYL